MTRVVILVNIQINSLISIVEISRWYMHHDEVFPTTFDLDVYVSGMSEDRHSPPPWLNSTVINLPLMKFDLDVHAFGNDNDMQINCEEVFLVAMRRICFSYFDFEKIMF